MQERRSFSHKTIYTVFAISLVLGFVAGLYIFFRFTTYETHALRRVPETARFVARVNVQQAVVHAPLQSSLMPLIEWERSGPEPRRKHLERRTTLELDVDVRELVYAELAPERWLLVAAGFLRPEEVLQGVGRMLDDEGIEHEVDGELLVWPSGVTLCVAADGTLVLAAAARDARAACRPPGQAPGWSAPLSDPGVALGIHAASGDRISPEAGEISHIRGASLVVRADSYFPTQGTLFLRGEEWKPAEVNQLLASKSNDFSYLFPLSSLRLRARVGDEFRVEGNLGREGFDAAIGRLAERIEASLGRPSDAR